MREPDPVALLRRIGWKTFTRWLDYDVVEPIGDRRGDWQAASICATVMNGVSMMIGSRVRSSPRDFILDFSEKPKEGGSKSPESGQPWQLMKFIAMQQVALSNAEEDRGKKRRRG